MADPQQDDSRPSFTNFWRKSKEAFAGRQITFVPSAGGQSPASPENDGDGALSQQQQGLSAQEKAQIRRAQVRKAQIQHRQRKANYIKQLELDVVRVRDMIAQVERETLGLRRENESMKSKLRAIGVSSPQWKGKQPAVPARGDAVGQDNKAPQQLFIAEQSQAYDHVNFPPPSATTDLFADVNVNDITVTLSMDSTMGTPCYKISTSSSSSVGAQSVASPRSDGEPAVLSMAQEDQAINFILSLEYICWDHFHPKDFPAKGDPDGRESCHTLMASTFCMSSAPDNVYKERRSLKRTGSRSPPPALSWQGSSLTLQNLRGLAASLNPDDKELTPVQAWFELAATYHVGVLLDAALLETLKREFVGVVKCVKYGATIERQAFESIIGRVMGQVGAMAI